MTPTSPPGRQRGQAAVFILLMTGMIALAAIFLYRAGKLTSEQMELQNAADSVAYSISVLEARDLNFMAYTNRAMVANEIAIGQAVGLMSWLNHLGSMPTFLRRYATLLSPIPFVGQAASAVLNGIAAGIEVVANIAKQAAGPLIAGAIPALVAASKVYSGAQVLMHLATTTVTITTLNDMLALNAPNAEISAFGWLGFIAHTVTYYSHFTKFYGSSSVEGMGRFAATVNESRDIFTRNRGYALKLPGDISFSAGPFSFAMQSNLIKAGGSQLRFKGDESSGKKFSWSAADTSAWRLGIQMGIDLGFVSADVDISNNQASVDLAFDFGLFSFDVGITLPMITEAPFGVGTAQASQSTNKLGVTDMGNLADQLPHEMYGYAPAMIVPYFSVPPFPNGVPLGISSSIASNKYSNLGGLGYNDTITPDDSFWSFFAPNLVIGLKADLGDIEDGNTAVTSGRLQLDSKLGNNNDAGVIAKSEVYFSRPNDLTFFQRRDGLQEFGSAFNPYWQARLVDTSYGERAMALLLQQQVVWTGDLESLAGSALDEVPNISDLLASLGLSI